MSIAVRRLARIEMMGLLKASTTTSTITGTNCFTSEPRRTTALTGNLGIIRSPFSATTNHLPFNHRRRLNGVAVLRMSESRAISRLTSRRNHRRDNRVVVPSADQRQQPARQQGDADNRNRLHAHRHHALSRRPDAPLQPGIPPSIKDPSPRIEMINQSHLQPIFSPQQRPKK